MHWLRCAPVLGAARCRLAGFFPPLGASLGLVPPSYPVTNYGGPCAPHPVTNYGGSFAGGALAVLFAGGGTGVLCAGEVGADPVRRKLCRKITPTESDLPNHILGAKKAKDVRSLVLACFEPFDWDSFKRNKPFKCRYCSFNKEFPSIQRPLQHIMGVAEKGGPPQAKACTSAGLPLQVRNQLRDHYNLPHDVPRKEATGKKDGPQMSQTTLDLFAKKEIRKRLDELQARAFYGENLHFALADRPLLMGAGGGQERASGLQAPVYAPNG